MKIYANGMHYAALNAAVRQSEENIEIFGCVGQRYLGSARGWKTRRSSFTARRETPSERTSTARS